MTEKLKKRLPIVKFDKEIVVGKVDDDIINKLKSYPIDSYLYKELRSLINYGNLINFKRNNLIADLYKYFNSNGNETYEINDIYDYILYDILYSNYYMQALQSIVKERTELAFILTQYIASISNSQIELLESLIQKTKLEVCKEFKEKKERECESFNGYNREDIKQILKEIVKRLEENKSINKTKESINKFIQLLFEHTVDNFLGKHSHSLTAEEIIEIQQIDKKAYEYLKSKMKRLWDNKKILNKVNTITGKVISSINVGEIISCNSNKLRGYDSCLSDDTGTLFALKYISEDFMNKEKKGSKDIDIYLDFSGSMTYYLDNLPRIYYALWIYMKLKKYFNVKDLYLFATRVSKVKDKRRFLEGIELMEAGFDKFMGKLQQKLDIGGGTDFRKVYDSIKKGGRTVIIVSDMDTADIDPKEYSKINRAYFIKLDNVIRTEWENIFTGIYNIV